MFIRRSSLARQYKSYSRGRIRFLSTLVTTTRNNLRLRSSHSIPFSMLAPMTTVWKIFERQGASTLGLAGKNSSTSVAGWLLKLIDKAIDKEDIQSMEWSYWLKCVVPIDEGRKLWTNFRISSGLPSVSLLHTSFVHRIHPLPSKPSIFLFVFFVYSLASRNFVNRFFPPRRFSDFSN